MNRLPLLKDRPMKINRIVTVFLSLLMLANLCGADASAQTAPVKAGIYVERIDGLDEDFIRGVDISSVISEERSGVVYKDKNGKKTDIFRILKSSGINYFRVRIWNDPFDENGRSYGGGANDVKTAAEIGKRAAKYGIKTYLDFHYSDFWADPSKQKAPKEWEKLSIDEKTDALYAFTKKSLQYIIKAGADVGIVQIGNETNGAMCGETGFENVSRLMSSGSEAVRSVDKDILVAVHFTDPQKNGSYEYYASELDKYKVDYDVFATSYYPYWHGSTENLTNVLKTVSDKYGKYVMVAETSYAYTYEDGDGFGNTAGEQGTYARPYQFTVQGQADCISDVIRAVHKVGKKGIGVCCWEPAWIPVKGKSYAARSKLWNKYGSGWASPYSAEYDPDDAGKYYGGSSWDNQALFSFDGKALESLDTFRYVYTGTDVTVKADAAEEVTVTVKKGGKIILPAKVNIIYNDRTKKKVSVKWKKFNSSDFISGKTNELIVYGTAAGMTVRCRIVKR